MNQKEIKRYLNVIKRAVSYIENMLENDDGGLLEELGGLQHSINSSNHITQAHSNHHLPDQQSVQKIEQQIEKVQETSVPAISPEELEKQQAARRNHVDALLAIDCWPEAVPEFLVAKDASEQDQVNRSNAVLDMMIDRSLDGCSFLDFGCGDGWIAQQVLKRGAKSSIGYDIKKSDTWSNFENQIYTTKLSDLKSSSFDVIMLYDVLDHCEDPIFVMNKLKNLIRPDGVIYIRCHPWVSKHATHLYKKGINKAYLHLFLTHNEIKELIGEDPLFTRTEKSPIQAYHWWFKDFNIKKERFVKEPTSEFFFVESFKELLANEQQVPLNDIDEFMKGLEIQFIDYCLTLK